MLTEAASTEFISSPQVGPGWFRLLRAARAAFDISKIVLAALGLVLLQSGWAALDRVFPESSAVAPARQALTYEANAGAPTILDSSSWEFLRSAGWRLTEPARMLATPLTSLFVLSKGVGWYVHAALAVLWVLIVGGILGGAIARIALLQVSRMERSGTLGAVRFALRFALPLITAPLFPLLAIGLCGLICAGVGLLFWLPAGIGSVVGGMLLFIPLLLGLVMALLLFGLAVGWPLLHASVAAEAEDLLDALSRSFSYLNQRLGKFVLCAILAWLIGIPGLVAVDLLATVVTHLAAWGVGLSAPASSLSGLTDQVAGERAIAQLVTAWPAFWRGVINLLVRGWIYAYFWTAASFIYLLLRQDVDGTPWTDVKDA
jgi:hypothetical protein